MRAFVLGTGRCGTSTFAAACSHITNYTLGHESRKSKVEKRVEYPDNHIEIDHRLSFFLGDLYRRYGGSPVYFHLERDWADTALSWSKRRGTGFGLMDHWPHAAFWKPKAEPRALAYLYVAATNNNIRMFLTNIPTENRFHSTIDGSTDKYPSIQTEFEHFWHRIGAEGDLDAALAEFDIKYNARVHASDANATRKRRV